MSPQGVGQQAVSRNRSAAAVEQAVLRSSAYAAAGRCVCYFIGYFIALQHSLPVMGFNCT